jgi:hypothetical protein
MSELLPTVDLRTARVAVSGTGWLCLGSVEHQIRLLNVSLTGILAELNYDNQIPDFNDMYKTLQAAPGVDLYLPELRLAGEASVIRVELVKGGFHIGIEFRNLSYNIDELLYKRRTFRKNLTTNGLIQFKDDQYHFNTENVALGGMVIRILKRIDFETGTLARFACKQLDIAGEVLVVWGDRDYNSTLLGLQFIVKEKTEFPVS